MSCEIETKTSGAETKACETPEIQKVISILDKEIQRLDANISLLTQQLDSVLTGEKTTQVSEDRPTRECKLAEDIQVDIDAISRMNELIDELRYRIAL